MVTKVHKPIEAKANEKTVSESNLIRSSRQDQLKINSFFREAHQKIRSEVEGIEHRIKVSLPEFESYEHTLYSSSEPDYWYLLCVRIEIPPYAMLGEFGVTHTRQVQTIREPFLARTGSDVEAIGVLGLTQQELENLASWSAGRKNSLMNPAPHLVIPSQVQALAWYCRLLALREFLQRLDLRMEKQSEIQRRYRERFEAAVGNPTEQVRIHIEYRSLHPDVAAADSWHLETIPLIPILQSQAMLDLAAKRQVEDRERRATETEATEAPVVTSPTPCILSAGKPRDEEIANRDHVIATLKESYKSLKGIRRNKRIAQSLDEQEDIYPPDAWGVRTFVEATENSRIRPAFDRMVAKAQYKKIPT